MNRVNPCLPKDIIYYIVSFITEFRTLKSIAATCKDMCAHVIKITTLQPICFFQQPMSSGRDKQMHYNAQQNMLYIWDKFQFYSFSSPPHFGAYKIGPISLGRHPIVHFKHCIRPYYVPPEWLNSWRTDDFKDGKVRGIGYHKQRDRFYMKHTFDQITKIIERGPGIEKRTIYSFSYYEDKSDVICILAEEEDAIYAVQNDILTKYIKKISLIDGKIITYTALPIVADRWGNQTRITSMAYHKIKRHIYFSVGGSPNIFVWDPYIECSGGNEQMEWGENIKAKCLMTLTKEMLPTCNVNALTCMAVDEIHDALYISDSDDKVFYVPIGYYE